MQHFKALQYTARVNQGLTKHLGQLMLHMTYSRQCKSGHPDGKFTNVGDSFELFRFPLVQQGFMAQLMLTCIIPAYVSLSKTLNLKESCFRRAECQFLKSVRREKVERDFLCRINKVSLCFYESCPGLLHWQLVFSINCNGNVCLVTHISLICNSSTHGKLQHKWFNQFSFCCCGRFV